MERGRGLTGKGLTTKGGMREQTWRGGAASGGGTTGSASVAHAHSSLASRPQWGTWKPSECVQGQRECAPLPPRASPATPPSPAGHRALPPAQRAGAAGGPAGGRASGRAAGRGKLGAPGRCCSPWTVPGPVQFSLTQVRSAAEGEKSFTFDQVRAAAGGGGGVSSAACHDCAWLYICTCQLTGASHISGV